MPRMDNDELSDCTDLQVETCLYLPHVPRDTFSHGSIIEAENNNFCNIRTHRVDTQVRLCILSNKNLLVCKERCLIYQLSPSNDFNKIV